MDQVTALGRGVLDAQHQANDSKIAGVSARERTAV